MKTKKKSSYTKTLVCLVLSAGISRPATADEPAWVRPMVEAHAKFDGQAGRVAQFGDSITYSMAFWSVMDWFNEPETHLPDGDGLPKTPKGKKWKEWIKGARDKGKEFGNFSGWKVGDILGVIDEVLRRDQPEIAMIMAGTNDISGKKVPDNYAAGLEAIVDKCLAIGCVPILNTIPPRRDHGDVVAEANAIISEQAGRKKIPLVDFHAAILERQPDGAWDGTLVSKDGVHPSGGETQNFSEENLRASGYALRNWLNFLAVREVYFRVFHPEVGS